MTSFLLKGSNPVKEEEKGERKDREEKRGEGVCVCMRERERENDRYEKTHLRVM